MHKTGMAATHQAAGPMVYDGKEFIRPHPETKTLVKEKAEPSPIGPPKPQIHADWEYRNETN